VFLIFPKEFERNQFLMALDQGFRVTYFEALYGKFSFLDGKRSDVFLVRFGRKIQEPERKDVREDPSRGTEHDDTKDQYFAFLTCLNSSDVDFTYALIHLIKEIKKHDPSPALILVGTAGGPQYLQSSRVLVAKNFDRGTMLDESTVLIDKELTVEEIFPGFFKGVTTHCSNWLMHFPKGSDFLDMESFEFSKVCKYMDIIDYACVRICSDTPGRTPEYLMETLKKFTSFHVDEKFILSEDYSKAAKQMIHLQKLLRKSTNFTNAVNVVIPVLKEYTLKRIRTIPNNSYETGEKKKRQEHLVQRHINEKLLNIYSFPLQDEEYFVTSGVTNREMVALIRETQEKTVLAIAEEFREAGF